MSNPANLPLRLSALDAAEVSRRLRGAGLTLRTGPFTFRIRSPIQSVADGLRLLYADYPLATRDEFADFTVTLAASGGLRRCWRRQVNFCYDGAHPFVPLPLDHAYPLLEWAMNWCISTQAHQYLTLHAAVLERNGCALILPAPPGSGKSTLCAGLTARGWRLLTDELALISPVDGLISPLARPISLKNQSLQVIRHFVPHAVLNAVTHDTTKGSVSHMKVPATQVHRAHERARPRWVVFPRYAPHATATLSPRPKAGSLLDLGHNAFNYAVHGLDGFNLLAGVVSASDCYDFRYSRLDDAAALFEQLACSAAA